MSKRLIRWTFFVASAAFLVYLGSYLSYRSAHSHTWQGHTIVVFGRDSARRSLYRPLEVLDALFTGARFSVFPDM